MPPTLRQGGKEKCGGPSETSVNEAVELLLLDPHHHWSSLITRCQTLLFEKLQWRPFEKPHAHRKCVNESIWSGKENFGLWTLQFSKEQIVWYPHWLPQSRNLCHSNHFHLFALLSRKQGPSETCHSIAPVVLNPLLASHPSAPAFKNLENSLAKSCPTRSYTSHSIQVRTMWPQTDSRPHHARSTSHSKHERTKCCHHGLVWTR